MTFQTKILNLDSTAPMNLTLDPDFLGTKIFLQNVGSTLVYIGDRTAAPAPADNGHVLGSRDAMVLEIDANEPSWVWSRSSSRIAISPA